MRRSLHGPVRAPRHFGAFLVLVLALAGRVPDAGAQAPPPPAVDSLAGVPLTGMSAILAGELLLRLPRAGGPLTAASDVRHMLEAERPTLLSDAARDVRVADIAARGYRTLASDPALTRDAISRVILNFYAPHPAAGPAETSARVDEQLLRLMLLQAAQNARLVEQNDRIIQLLELTAARR